MSSGDEQDVQERRKKRYHRHTVSQIQQLEEAFRRNPHPTEKQRMQLSKDLGLEPKQIKFWFQNRRTQKKAQAEKNDNQALRTANDRLRAENVMFAESLRHAICPNCGGQQDEDPYIEEQRLRMQNASLKEELEKVANLTSKFLGKPATQLPPIQPASVSSLDLSVGRFPSPGFGPPLDLDFFSGSPSNISYPFLTPVSEAQKPAMIELANNALDELIRLVGTNEPLWTKPGNDGREVLHLENYDRIFEKPGQFMGPNLRVEASRDSCHLNINPINLVEMFLDPVKWKELFPTIVSNARTVEVLQSGMMGNSRTGTILLMYGEFQVLSPSVPTREFLFLRCCQQIDQGWVIADVSVEFPRDPNQPSPPLTRRLPSGCLIQEAPNDLFKITWVEHMEVEDKNPTQGLFQELVHSGMAFGAQRWIATLQRMCQRFEKFTRLMMTGPNSREPGEELTPEARSRMMLLSQRMLAMFFSNMCPSNGQLTPPGLSEDGVVVTSQRSKNPGQPGFVLCATTSFYLPHPCQSLFHFFRDPQNRRQWDVLTDGIMNRRQWDVLTDGIMLREITNSIETGSTLGNCISLLSGGLSLDPGSALILQESFTDSMGSGIVYSPLDSQSVNIMTAGEDISYIPLIPMGFTILPDCRPGGASGASTSANPLGTSSGSILTVSLQINVRNNSSPKYDTESLRTVNSLISNLVMRMRAAVSNSP